MHSILRTAGLKAGVAVVMLLAASTAALATPEEPVRKIMDLATALWSANPPEGSDYFDANHLGLFSKDFVAVYREAAKFPIEEDGDDVFGYDVITNNPEGCALRDMSISPGAETAGVTVVQVTFKSQTCLGEGPETKAVTQVAFRIVREDGKPVIDDISHIVAGKPASLVEQMKAQTGERRAGRE